MGHYTTINDYFGGSMNNLQRVLGYTKLYWKTLLFSIICATLFGIVAAVPTYLLKSTIDDIFIKRHQHLILPFILAFVLFFALKGLFMYLSSYYMHWVGNKVVNDLRRDLFSKIVHLPMSFFQGTTTGKLMSHFLNDIQMIQVVSSNVVKDGVRSFFEAIFLLGIAFYQNWQLSLVLLVVGPLIGITIGMMGKARKKASKGIQLEMGKVSNMLQESFVGIREIKAFNAEAAETNQFKNLLTRCFNSVMSNVRIESLAPACVEIIAMAGCSVVFYIAAQQVLNGSITAGQLTSFAAAMLLSYQPLKKLVNIFGDIQYGMAAADRVFALMDHACPTIQNRTQELTAASHTIRWENVSFGYNEHATILSRVNLTIKNGECIGVVGASGAGKSTFCDLLLGFISATDGTIWFNETNLANITYSSLRNRIGYVGQRPFLFNDTVYNNILYARPEATEEEIIKACKAAHADEFIRNLPEGYHTMVGENGTLLSGGQKQRITIARALLKDPEILIFDEATSSLDHESENYIRQAIDELRGHKTLIIVSHRPTMLENVDRILSIHNKKITEISKEEQSQETLA